MSNENYGLLTVVHKVVSGLWNGAVASTATFSLTDVGKMTRVEPVTIVSKDCLNLEYLPAVSSTLCNLFSAYYLQAINILSKVNNVEVIRTLERLNPDRDLSNIIIASVESIAAAGSRTLCLEHYKHSLPMRSVQPSLENENTKSLSQEVSNAAVGRLLEVDIAYGKEGKTTKVPMSVRLDTRVVNNQGIRGILTHNAQDMAFIERIHAFRAGQIEFWRDVVMCQDVIDSYKKATIEDKTDSLQEILRRAANSRKLGLLTLTPSLAAATTLFIISDEVAREVEGKLGGRLTNYSIRQKAFDNTYAMIICVIDREHERIMFYIRDQHAYSDLSIKEIKSSGGNNKGPDVMDMMKALMSGTPVF